MRNKGVLLGAILTLGLAALAGCDNTQGTSANPEMSRETVSYTGNDNPQNTGAGAGTMMKPPPMMGSMTGGDSPSQAVVKGTDNATGAFPASLTGPHSGTTAPAPSTLPAGTPAAGSGTMGSANHGTTTGTAAPGSTGGATPGTAAAPGTPGTTGTAAPTSSGSTGTGGATPPAGPSSSPGAPTHLTPPPAPRPNGAPGTVTTPPGATH